MGLRDRGKTPYDNEYGPASNSEVRILFPISKLWSFFTKKKKEDTKKVSEEAPASPKRTGNNDGTDM